MLCSIFTLSLSLLINFLKNYFEYHHFTIIQFSSCSFFQSFFKDRKFVLVLLHKYKFLTSTVLKSFALSTLISIAGRKAANPTTKFRVLPSGLPIGGDEQNRTVDPLLARQVLSQLSYTPVFVLITISELLSIHLNYYSLFKDALHLSPCRGYSTGGLKWTRTTDLTLIRRAL